MNEFCQIPARFFIVILLGAACEQVPLGKDTPSSPQTGADGSPPGPMPTVGAGGGSTGVSPIGGAGGGAADAGGGSGGAVDASSNTGQTGQGVGSVPTAPGGPPGSGWMAGICTNYVVRSRNVPGVSTADFCATYETRCRRLANNPVFRVRIKYDNEADCLQKYGAVSEAAKSCRAGAVCEFPYGDGMSQQSECQAAAGASPCQ